MAGFTSRLKHAFNAFTDQDELQRNTAWNTGSSYGVRPDRVRLRFSNERTIISSIYTRISIDVASVDLRHVRLDNEDRYMEDIDSGLNNCLKVEANLDQAARAFRQNIAMSLLGEGSVAIVAVDTNVNPMQSSSYEIQTMRVGQIVSWYPQHVRVSLYNDQTGRREEITLEKKNVAIVENPLYSVMNEQNSTLQRLTRKLHLLDAIDEQTGSGKLDLIIQLPYVVKSESRRAQAEKRRQDIEFQLKGSKYGIAYTDGTEKITQLNRPVENNLWKQIQDLTAMLYSELGLTPEVMNGTANEATMLNYNNRTIEPILGAISEAMARTYLTKTARTQGQSIQYFRDPFKLVPMADLAEMADKFTRNEIFSSNEMRGFIGVKPSTDPKADTLNNSNMPQPQNDIPSNPASPDAPSEEAPVNNDALSSSFDEIDAAINEAFAGLGLEDDDPNA